MRAKYIAARLGLAQLLPIHQQRFGVGRLAVDHTLQHGFQLRLDIVALVDHIGHIVCLVAGADQFVKDIEQLERVGRTNDQIVVGILACIEVKAA